MISPQVVKLLSARRVLLLQGPIGSFFAQFSDWLNHNGIESYKVNFNGGDWLYYHGRDNIFHFRKSMTCFKAWLEQLVAAHDIDTIICFGDCRQQHILAKEMCDEKHLSFFAFEEGYIRPNYITFEQDGVNFHSNFKAHLLEKKRHFKNFQENARDAHSDFRKLIFTAIYYYTAWFALAFLYPQYKHHRGYGPLKEAFFWIVSGIRRLINKTREQSFAQLFEQQKNNYFVFTLQVHNDSQLLVHSEHKCMKHYIQQVIESFAAHAPSKKLLVIKHHPMDRGYTHYGQFIRDIAAKNHVEQRVVYCCDVNLPSLLKGCNGMVTVNSTTGIQAFFHNIPVKVLGDAIFDLPRLSNRSGLDQFWIKPGRVDHKYFDYFRKQLIYYSQLNGSFYGENPWMQDKK